VGSNGVWVNLLSRPNHPAWPDTDLTAKCVTSPLAEAVQYRVKLCELSLDDLILAVTSGGSDIARCGPTTDIGNPKLFIVGEESVAKISPGSLQRGLGGFISWLNQLYVKLWLSVNPNATRQDWWNAHVRDWMLRCSCLEATAKTCGLGDVCMSAKLSLNGEQWLGQPVAKDADVNCSLKVEERDE
jgi:hypothetical protein